MSNVNSLYKQAHALFLGTLILQWKELTALMRGISWEAINKGLPQSASIRTAIKFLVACVKPGAVFGAATKRSTSALAHLLVDGDLANSVYMTENVEEDELFLKVIRERGDTVVPLLNLDPMTYDREGNPMKTWGSKLWVKVADREKVCQAMGIQARATGQAVLKQAKYVKQLCAPNSGGAWTFDIDPNEVIIMNKEESDQYDGGNYISHERFETITGWKIPFGAIWIFRLFWAAGLAKGGLMILPTGVLPPGKHYLFSEVKSDVMVRLDGKATLVLNSKAKKTKEAPSDGQTFINNFQVTDPDFSAMVKHITESQLKRFLDDRGRTADLVKKAEGNLEDYESKDAVVEIAAALIEENIDIRNFPSLYGKILSLFTDGALDNDRVRIAGGSYNEDGEWITHCYAIYMQVHPGMLLRSLESRFGYTISPEVELHDWLRSDLDMKDGVVYTDTATAEEIIEVHGPNGYKTRSPNTLPGGTCFTLEGLEDTPEKVFFIKPTMANWILFFVNNDGEDLDDRSLAWFGEMARLARKCWQATKSNMIALKGGNRTFMEEEKLVQVQDWILNPLKPWNLDKEGKPVEEESITDMKAGLKRLDKLTAIADSTAAVNEAMEVQNLFRGMTGTAANWQMFMGLALQGLVRMPQVKSLDLLAQATVSCMLSDIIDCENQGASPEAAVRTLDFYYATSRYMHYVLMQYRGEGRDKAMVHMVPQAKARAIGRLKSGFRPIRAKDEEGEYLMEKVYGVLCPVYRKDREGNPLTSFPSTEISWETSDLIEDCVASMEEAVKEDVTLGLGQGVMNAYGQAAQATLAALPEELKAKARSYVKAASRYNRAKAQLSKEGFEAMRRGVKIEPGLLKARTGELNDEWLQEYWMPLSKQQRSLMCLGLMATVWTKACPLSKTDVKLKGGNIRVSAKGLYDDVLWLQDINHGSGRLDNSDTLGQVVPGPWRMTVEVMQRLVPALKSVGALEYKIEMLGTKIVTNDEGEEKTVYLAKEHLTLEFMQTLAEGMPTQYGGDTFQAGEWSFRPAIFRTFGTINAMWKGDNEHDIAESTRLKKAITGLDIKKRVFTPHPSCKGQYTLMLTLGSCSEREQDERGLLIKVNNFNRDDLLSLHGVGPKTADKVLAALPYTSVSDIPGKVTKAL